MDQSVEPGIVCTLHFPYRVFFPGDGICYVSPSLRSFGLFFILFSDFCKVLQIWISQVSARQTNRKDSFIECLSHPVVVCPYELHT